MKTTESSSQEIYEKTWAGNYWGTHGAIAQSRRRLTHPATQGEISALSSTYYSASAQAYAKFRTSPLYAKPLWAFRALWCLLNAGMLSDTLEERFGIENMTPDQLDIRARILFRQRRYLKALRVTENALAQDVAPDTRILLLMGLAEIREKVDQIRQAEEAYRKSLDLVNHARPTTSIRLYKSLAGFYRRQGDLKSSLSMVEKALAIANAHGLSDQITKLEPLLT